MDTKTLVKIAEFHKDYENENLKERIKSKREYLKSPKDALFFILSYSFYQGRLDKISGKFEKKAKKALEKFFRETDPFSSNSFRRIPIIKYIEEKKKKLKAFEYEKELKPRYSKLLESLEANGVSKRGDRLMVASLINFIESSEEKNLVKMIIQKIKSKKLEEVYNELDGIWSIGSKIASLILRDIVYIYKLEPYLDKESYYYLQPVDTWVHQVSKELKLIDLEKAKDKNGKSKIYEDEAKDITDKCFEFGVNPIHYNQGAWYVGSNSLQILLKNVEMIK